MKIQYPKNIQQIGESPFDKRVYLEDYVATFLEQMKKRDKGAGRTVLLYGRREQEEEQTCYFVYGAVIRDDAEEPEKQKDVFPAYQVIGEAYICREGEEIQRRLQDYGAVSSERILFLVGDAGDNQAAFLTGQGVCLLSGYYIFYEKNEMMQNILLDWYRDSREKEETSDKDYAVREFRERYCGQQEDVRRRKMMSLLYGASLLLLMLCCITGISMVNQYDKMLQMQANIEHLMLALNERELPEAQPVFSNTANLEMENEVAAESWETVGETAEVPETAVEYKDAGKDAQSPAGDTGETDCITSDTKAEAGPDERDTDGNNTQLELETVAVQEVVYTVKKGDTLAAISKSYYGTITKVKEICEKNQIEEPDSIFVGQKILLP